MTKFDDAIQLIAGDRQLDTSNAGLCVDLMKKFLRREALWAKQLRLTDEVPFANLAGVISKINHAEPYLEAIKMCTYSVAKSRCCSAMLNWYRATNVSESNIRERGIPDPSQPLLQFFQLGGTFDREHRVFIRVNGMTTIQANTIQQGDLSKAFISMND